MTILAFLKHNFVFLDRLQYFFSLNWKSDGDSKSDIVLYLKWLSGPQKSNFPISLFMDQFFLIFFLWLVNSMGISNPILYFTSNASLDHKSPISCLWTNLNIFFLWLGNSIGIPNVKICTKNNSSLMPEKMGFGGLWGAGQNEYFFRKPYTCPYKYFCSWHFHTNFKQKPN